MKTYSFAVKAGTILSPFTAKLIGEVTFTGLKILSEYILLTVNHY